MEFTLLIYATPGTSATASNNDHRELLVILLVLSTVAWGRTKDKGRQARNLSGKVAVSNMKIRNNKKKGFTLVEIMIVVLIIGILLAIAVPNFVRARERSRAKTCVGNLKQIDSAKEQYAMEERLDSGATVAGVDLYGDGSAPGPYIKKPPVCASGGTYTVGDVGTDPTCSIGGEHSLDAL